MSRLSKFIDYLKDEGIDKFLVTNITNVRYLSGFTGSTACLVVDDSEATLVTDFRYKEQAEAEVWRGTKVKVDNRETLTAALDVLGDFDGKLGFEALSLAYSSYTTLSERLKAKLVPTSGAVERLRRTKDSNEVATIARAVKIADEVFSEILEEIKPGLTEVDIAARIDFLLRKKSQNIPAFETIVASGPHSSLPHAQPTSRIISEGDMVKMDFGAIWDGYRSDITRTVFVGKASDKFREIYDIVLHANEEAISGIRAGLKASEADRLARALIESRGYGENFGHSLGHGVGLEVHEAPRLSSKNDSPLEAGNVVTVEPGIYIPGWGGVRIEDMVLVDSDGCTVLTKSSKDLIEVGT